MTRFRQVPPARRAPLTLISGILAIGLLCRGLPAAGSLSEGETPPFVVTPERVVDRMLEMAQVRPTDTVMDLGSGDGRIVIRAAEKFGARAIGVELDARLVALSRAQAQRAGVAERVRFERGDALLADLRPASVLTLYLGPNFNERLLPRILSTMTPGSRVLSHDFGLGTWRPDRTERLYVPEKNHGRGGDSFLMLWIVPADAAGRWRVEDYTATGAHAVEFSIRQQFQVVEGVLHAAGRDLAFPAAELRGKALEFTLPSPGGPAREISVAIEADRMHGTIRVQPDAAPIPFSARRIRSRPDIF